MVLKWVIILLSFFLFSFMVVDGSRALMIGDYFRPETGEYAGQLGPWAGLVKSVNIDPESDFMKWMFLLWGAIGLFIMVAFAMKVRDSAKALLIISLLTLWYLTMGTMLSLAIAVLTFIYWRLNKSKPSLKT
ncbi:MAG: hypothetical protein R2800_00855 [Flavipsychrobacter sp.]